MRMGPWYMALRLAETLKHFETDATPQPDPATANMLKSLVSGWWVLSTHLHHSPSRLEIAPGFCVERSEQRQGWWVIVYHLIETSSCDQLAFRNMSTCSIHVYLLGAFLCFCGCSYFLYGGTYFHHISIPVVSHGHPWRMCANSLRTWHSTCHDYHVIINVILTINRFPSRNAACRGQTTGHRGLELAWRWILGIEQ